jgi:hypothetical protein
MVISPAPALRSHHHVLGDLRRRRVVDQSELFAELEELLPHEAAAPMEAAHHRPDGAADLIGDLPVREPLQIRKDHHHAEVLGKTLERILDLRAREPGHQAPLGILVAPDQQLLGVRVPARLDLLEELDLGTAGPALVDVVVGHDAEEPRPGVGAGLVLLDVLDGLGQGVLGELLGAVAVTGHGQRVAEERVHVWHELPFDDLPSFAL